MREKTHKLCTYSVNTLGDTLNLSLRHTKPLQRVYDSEFVNTFQENHL